MQTINNLRISLYNLTVLIIAYADGHGNKP
jgi:hypothetical protein